MFETIGLVCSIALVEGAESAGKVVLGKLAGFAACVAFVKTFELDEGVVPIRSVGASVAGSPPDIGVAGNSDAGATTEGSTGAMASGVASASGTAGGCTTGDAGASTVGTGGAADAGATGGSAARTVGA